MVTQTSRAAYAQIQDSIGVQERRIAKALHTIGPANITGLAQWLNMEKSSVSGRLNELKKRERFLLDDGQPYRLAFAHEKKCPVTNINTEWWRIEPVNQQNPKPAQ